MYFVRIIIMIEKFKNFSALNNESDPLKIDIVGETYCDKNFKIERACSDLNALEFIIDGKGTLDIDGQNLVIQINKDDALYCYEKGILPLNVLANSVLKAYDRERDNISMEYDRQQNMQEESRQSVQLK